MIININKLQNDKHSIILDILSEDKYQDEFKKLNLLIMQKQFSNLSDLSIIENILLSKNNDLSKKDINKVVKNYISEDCSKILSKTRTTYELIKILNLPKQKTEKILNTNCFIDIINKSNILIENSNLISQDLSILRIIDNIFLRTTKFEIQNEYFKTKRNLINKLSTFNYKKEKKEKDVTILCWLDVLLNNLQESRISPDEYILITQKILDLTTPSIDVYCKLISSLNIILLEQKFSGKISLKNYRKYISRYMDINFSESFMEISDVRNILVDVLAKDTPSREYFYYLFDIIKNAGNMSIQTKYTSLVFCRFILEYNKKFKIFNLRFIRKYFIDMFFKLLDNIDNIKIKEEEMNILLKLFHTDVFYNFYKKDIFDKMVKVVKMIGRLDKTSNTTFYKYCDILDYILHTNKDINFPNIFSALSSCNVDQSKIFKRFTLYRSQFKY
jgi:hypothetical protein